MDENEIRRANLRRWIDEDPHAEGNIEKWCDHYSKKLSEKDRPFSPGYIRQLVPKYGVPHGNIGEKTARKIERAMGRARGSMDHPPDQVGEQELVSLYRAASPESRLLVDALLGVRGFDALPEQGADALRLALKWSAPADKSSHESAA